MVTQRYSRNPNPVSDAVSMLSATTLFVIGLKKDIPVMMTQGGMGKWLVQLLAEQVDQSSIPGILNVSFSPKKRRQEKTENLPI